MNETLRRDGVMLAPWDLSRSQVDDLLAHLDRTEVYNAHVAAKASEHAPLPSVRGGSWPAFSHTMHDVVTAPHWFEVALRGYPVARDYFGEEPRLYSINAFWTQPGSYQYQDTHGWHRDGDDRKQLVMFAYGTDVRQDADGAHKYQRGTMDKADDGLGYPFTDPPGDVVETILGSAGTCFFVDTRGLHIGIRPSRPRLLIGARWGVSARPESYDWDRLEPVPAAMLGERYPTDPVLRKAVELVIS